MSGNMNKNMFVSAQKGPVPCCFHRHRQGDVHRPLSCWDDRVPSLRKAVQRGSHWQARGDLPQNQAEEAQGIRPCENEDPGH